VAEADAGDFIFVPPYAAPGDQCEPDETLECVLRSDNEAVVVNRTSSR
jgi:uncharacterized RmlC-like cupin family protein